MVRRIIFIDSEDDVIIDLSGGRKAPLKSTDELPQTTGSVPPLGQAVRLGEHDGDPLILTSRLTNLMELRAESSFRVNQADLEVIYALSGSDTQLPETFHHLASKRVVEDARPDTVKPIITGMLDLIRSERSQNGDPRIIVINHTHPAPGNVPYPSSNDERFFESSGPILNDIFPDARIVFGVHAISGESVRRREDPTITALNRLRWTSVIREHEVAFFNPQAGPVAVEYHD